MPRLSTDDVLEAMREAQCSAIDIDSLGERLAEIGVTEEVARALVSAIKDARRRPHYDDDGVWHPGLRVEIAGTRIARDDDEPLATIDFEAQWCWHDDEQRTDAFLRATRSKTTPRLPRTREDDPVDVDELRILPERELVEILEVADEELLLNPDAMSNNSKYAKAAR